MAVVIMVLTAAVIGVVVVVAVEELRSLAGMHVGV